MSILYYNSTNFATDKETEKPNAGTQDPIKEIQINFGIMYFISLGDKFMLWLQLTSYKQRYRNT